MKSAAQKKLVPVQPVENLIRIIRDQKVILDSDLAELYGVETKILNQSVQRNIERFPDDFMFRLSTEEASRLRSRFVTLKKEGPESSAGRANMRSQIVTASKRNVRYQPLAFTEHGIAMLSSVLRSPRAIQMNILIVRAFMRMRELIAANKDVASRIEKLERGHERVNSLIEVLIEDIDKLSRDIHWIKNPPIKPKHRIGFVFEKESEE